MKFHLKRYWVHWGRSLRNLGARPQKTEPCSVGEVRVFQSGEWFEIYSSTARWGQFFPKMLFHYEMFPKLERTAWHWSERKAPEIYSTCLSICSFHCGVCDLTFTGLQVVVQKSDDIWKMHVLRKYPDRKPDEFGSWREVYLVRWIWVYLLKHH